MEEEIITRPRKGLVNIRYSYLIAQGSPGYLPLPQELRRLRITDFVRKYTSNFAGGNQCADGLVTKKERKEPAVQPKAKRSEFDTQITFYVELEGEQLQIKIFTRNSVHVPELPTDDFGLADRAVTRLLEYLNECFADCDLYNPVSLGPANVMLCNYSGLVRVPDKHTLNLAELAAMASTDTLGPAYCYTQYSRGDIRLKLFFLNPTPKKPYKTTSVAVQLGGKIVIMGDNDPARISALYYTVARLIYHNRLAIFWPAH